MRDSQNIKDLLNVGVDYMGFIFYEKSPRFAEPKLDVSLLNSKAFDQVQKVGVFVNEEVDRVVEITKQYGLDVLQLHGKETIEDCALLKDQTGCEIIKVFGVGEKFEFSSILAYDDVADYYLFDTKSEKHGGTGKQFDWELLKGYDAHKPFFLSGGIGLQHVEAIKSLPKTWNVHALDVNSLFEEEPAFKNIQLIKEFKKALNQA